jgi:hypothetical protein
VLLLNECLLFISLSTQSGNFWIHPRTLGLLLKVHSQTGHVLIDERRHLNTVDVRSFTGDDGNTDHYKVVAKVKETVSK